MNSAKVFKAKKNIKMLFSGYLIIGFGIFLLVFVFISNDLKLSDFYLFLPIVGVLIIISIYIFYGLNRVTYTIQKNELLISEQFFYYIKIPIQNIRKIEEIYSLLQLPTMTSNQGLEIYYNKFDSTMISPKLQEEFIKTLISINPKIEIVYKK